MLQTKLRGQLMTFQWSRGDAWQPRQEAAQLEVGGGAGTGHRSRGRPGFPGTQSPGEYESDRRHHLSNRALSKLPALSRAYVRQDRENSTVDAAMTWRGCAVRFPP